MANEERPLQIVHTKQTYTFNNLSVSPIPETLRRTASGTAIDVRIEDARSTITYATVNVALVIDRQGRPYSY